MADIFTVALWSCGPMNLTNMTVFGRAIALLAQLVALYLSCLWGYVNSWTDALYPVCMTVTMPNSRQFYCKIMKVWTHVFDKCDKVTREIALLAHLVALYPSCLWGYVKRFSVVSYPVCLTGSFLFSRHVYSSIMKLWTHEFDRGDNSVRIAIALLEQTCE